MTTPASRFFYLLGGLFACLTMPPAAQARTLARPGFGPAADVPSLDGLWKGQLKVPGGQLEVIFRLRKLTGGNVALPEVGEMPRSVRHGVLSYFG